MKSWLKKNLFKFSIVRIFLDHFKFIFPKKYYKRLFDSYLVYANLSIFSRARLHKVKDLYWTIIPMPTLNELTKFYKNVYWQKYRSNSIPIVKKRDIYHFNLINSKVKIKSLDKIINFGSGPGGGISHLFFAKGKTVIDVEPGPYERFYNEKRYIHYKKLSEIPKYLKIDLLYGSHSLEHVADLSEIEEFIRKQLNLGGYVFWEVPNGLHYNSGPVQNKIVPPHTYYFTRKYFDQIGLKPILNATFFGEKIASGDRGNIIRFLGIKEK